MHLEGYGCAGTSAVAYGLACLELEAGDSGFRSFVSVQGSLAMYAIWAHGSEEQKQTWLPRMAAGEAIGCFGLTEPDFGSDPGGMRTVARRYGADYVLNGTKAWITNGGIADVAIVWARTDPADGPRSGAIRGFVVPTNTKGFSTRNVERKLSLRASVTSELILEDVRLPGRRHAARASKGCAARCRASTRRATASCGGRSAPGAPATRARSSTPRRGCSSAARSPASSSRKRSWPT